MMKGEWQEEGRMKRTFFKLFLLCSVVKFSLFLLLNSPILFSCRIIHMYTHTSKHLDIVYSSMRKNTLTVLTFTQLSFSPLDDT
jgi:hypothetical protein